MARERYLDRPQSEALARLREESRESRLLSVRFDAADTPRDVVHGVNVDPTRLAYRVVRGTARVIDAPGVVWTREVAWLQSDRDNSEAWVEFYVLDTDPALA